MACFLIDYENESGTYLEGISLLDFAETDRIIFFYSKNASKITMALHMELEKIPAEKLYVKVETGPQSSLDFQLSSYLGAIVWRTETQQFYKG